jgi:hypothetical protein
MHCQDKGIARKGLPGLDAGDRKSAKVHIGVEDGDKSHACQKKGQEEAEIVGVIDGRYKEGKKQEGEQ